MGNVVEGQGQAAKPELNLDNRRLRYTDKQKEEALKHIDAGLSYRQTAALVGEHVSSGTIARWVKDRNSREDQAKLINAFRIQNANYERMHPPRPMHR